MTLPQSLFEGDRSKVFFEDSQGGLCCKVASMNFGS